MIHLFLLLIPFVALFAQELSEKLVEEPVITEHVYTSNGKEIAYDAVAGMLPVISKDGETLAHLFYVAYFADTNEENRPITFFFPGGPGGSCGLEAICSVGPRRLVMPKEGKKLLPPYKMIDNPESLLPWTDLVFVDPVGTGYSKISKSDDDDQVPFPFFSTDGDIAALGNFVRTFISYFEKWNSPKYLAGISYGAARSCGLAEYLSSHDISLHGILLLSPAIDYATLLSQHNQPIPNALMLPTFAATAWYHHRFMPDASLEEVVDYARRFTFDDYIPFMLQPNRLSPYEQDLFYEKQSLLMGLSIDTVKRYSGSFDEGLYTSEFFATEKKVLGGLDSRYTGDIAAINGWEKDPSYKDMQGAWCAFKAYLQKDLQLFAPFTPYFSYSRNYWDFSSKDSIYFPELFQRVKRTLIHNSDMKVFVGVGFYDCRTPFAATEYCFDHMGLPESYRENIHFSYYKGGHGFIFDTDLLKKLKDDLIPFYTEK